MPKPRLPLGPHPETPSQQALLRVLDIVSQTALEAAGGGGQNAISAYALRRSRPGADAAARLEEATRQLRTRDGRIVIVYAAGWADPRLPAGHPSPPSVAGP